MMQGLQVEDGYSTDVELELLLWELGVLSMPAGDWFCL